MSPGYLALTLHAHLPYVRHPEHEHFLEEDWLYEAITESYIPLLQACEAMAADGVPFRLTLSMSPPLCSMLTDDLLRERYWRHLLDLRDLVGKELVRNAKDGHLLYLARHYEQQVEAAIRTWQQHDGDLVRAFARLQDDGFIDILTSAATHGYLPLLQVHPEAVRAQIEVACQHHLTHFGRRPSGIWLPECGYYPGLDSILAEAGLRYFVADAHGLLFAAPRPRHGTAAPIFCAGSGVAAFGRDIESSVQVWSRDRGYPGDFTYREFYRDIGHDLELDYIGPHVQPDGRRKDTGIKYHRITGPGEHKDFYDPYWARERAAEHAADFVDNRGRQIEHLGRTQAHPVIVAPYDAELFGHWWYEGPWWLEFLMRKAVYDQRRFSVTHLAEYLREHPTHQACWPVQSSWGDRGFNEFWLNRSNEWIYPHLHMAAERMIGLATDLPEAEGQLERALNQCARELLLAQASDWAFIMRTGTMVDYAEGRTRSHLQRFTRLHDEIRTDALDEAWLAQLEYVDNIFPELDYRVYLPRG
jgi:1,4-alpha-glucan branching enzyme